MRGLRHIIDNDSKIPEGSLILLIGLDREDNQSFGNFLAKALRANDIAPAVVAPYPITSKGASRLSQFDFMGEEISKLKRQAFLGGTVRIERIDPDSIQALGPLATGFADIVLRVTSKNIAITKKNRFGPREVSVLLREEE